METLFQRLLLDPLADLGVRQLVGLAMSHFYAFTLVFVRMSGLMTIGPVFGQSFVPANVRVLLVLAMSLLITPTLSDQAQVGFQRLDENHDSRVSRDEVPEPL
ncbi:MAG: flagellar biosynthetic protein FliR, partial [Planctomycetaceae bacterium]